MEDALRSRFEAMESDCDVEAEDNYQQNYLSDSLDCSELLGNDESFSPACSDPRGPGLVAQQNAAWASASSAAAASAAEPAMSTLPSEDGIREMIRQELFAEQEARREAACCAAGGTEAHPPAVWAEHRRVLCEWTLALCRAAGMTRETFCLAASLLDRYVTECCAAMGDKGYPSEGTLQLLAMTCLSLAMKYEEVAPLHSADLLRLAIDPCTGALLYTAADLARMEWLVLQMLSWRVRMPTAASFLTLLLPACGAASAASSSLADVPCRDGSAHAHVSAGELLVHWATRLLDMCVLLAHQLPHQASTIAMACLLIAERLSSANAAATQRILQFWRELLPNVGQQQQQLQQVQQCARAVEAMWCAAHGDCTHLFSYQLQYVTAAVSQAAAPAPAPAMCAHVPPVTHVAGRGLYQPSVQVVPVPANVMPSGYQQCAREDHVFLIQRQYLAWAQEHIVSPEVGGALMPHSNARAAVLSW